MPQKPQVIGIKSCPVCNAEAKLKVEERGEVLLVFTQCPKCREKRHAGITNYATLRLSIREAKLLEALRFSGGRLRAEIEYKLQQLQLEKLQTKYLLPKRN